MPKTPVSNEKIIPTLRMSEEEQQIGRDLVDHAINKIKTVVADMVELHDHPAHIYMLNFAALEFFMHGMAVFDISTVRNARKAVRERNKMDRIIRATGMAMIMTLAQRGSKECQQLIKRANHLAEMDGREVLRFLSQLQTHDDDPV